MVYRNRFEIQATILEAAGRGASKTRVMYNATVSHFQLCSYLKDLVETGLIEYDSSIRLYRTTTKGLDFLNSFKELNGMLEGTVQPEDHSEFREENVGSDNLTVPYANHR